VVKRTICTAVAALLLAGTAPAQSAAKAGPAPQGAPAALTFSAALELAASRNLGLEAARRQRAIREAQVRIAGQWANPEVSFEVTQDSPHENLAFGYPIEIGGQRGRRIAVAKEELALADLDVRAETRTLRRNLRQAFYGVIAADERVRLAGEVADLVERTRQAAQARFEEGAAPRLEVLQADLGVARAQAEADLARSARASALADLNAVLNQPPGQAVAVAGDLGDAPPPPDFARAMELAAASNGEILSAEREAAVEARRMDLWRAERVPTPTITYGLPMNAPDEFTIGQSLGFAMTIPLFTRNQGEIAQSQAAIDQLRARRAAARRVVESQVFAALARIDAQRKQVESYRTRIIPAAVELAALAEESYKMGRNPVLALLEAQRALRDVRREYLQALLEFQAALADLEEVIGGPIA
jgi:cobalt-zinc-cadmium efflux system outer membrane protein